MPQDSLFPEIEASRVTNGDLNSLAAGLPRVHPFHRFLSHLLHRRLEVSWSWRSSPLNVAPTFDIPLSHPMQRRRGKMHSLERKPDPTNRSRFQHFLHGLLFHTGKR